MNVRPEPSTEPGQLHWATARGLHVIGEPEVNRYDPPWTLWFLRRNEVWMTLGDAAGSSR